MKFGLAITASRSEQAKMLIILSALTWVSHYLFSSGFGFYEDDYTFASQAMAADWEGVWEFISSLWLRFGGHGRPLENTLIYLFSHTAQQLGGLQIAYVMGFILQALSAYLFYLLLKRISNDSIAIIGAIAFALYPADTTQAFLTHALGIKQSVLFIILASLSYLGGRQLFAYLFLLASLITYETAFPVFLAIPLMSGEWDRKMAKRVTINALIMGIIFAIVVAIRTTTGAGRIASLDLETAILTPIRHMGVGPLTSLGMYFYRPIQTISSLDARTGLVTLFVFIGLILALLKLLPRAFPVPGRQLSSRAHAENRISKRLSYFISNPLNRLLLIGGLMLILAYPLTFGIRSFSISGRATRIHMSAILGATLLFSSSTYALMRIFANRNRRNVAVILLAGYLALLAGFGVVVQSDYLESWRLQQDFWRNIVELVPDLEDGTVIIVEPTGLHDTDQIGANTWNLPRVLAQLFAFPTEWDARPAAYRLKPNWTAGIAGSDGRLVLDESTSTAPPANYANVRSEDVVFIDSEGGQLVRLRGVLDIAGVNLPLKTMGEPSARDLSPGFLYDYLISNGNN
jgi:hypothetical protein